MSSSLLALPTESSTPASPVGTQTSPATTESAELRHDSRERILLVEDEDVLRRLACAVLTREGYSVFEATGPAHALEIAAHEPDSMDLILADVIMPGMRGYEMVDRLRPLQPRARVLYMSGYVGELEAAHEGKIIPLLEKPFKPRELLDEIRKVLDG
jgi:CheY-like chemotaxis protein